MYQRFFGLERLPFEASPDPGFLFDGPAHREAIASIEYAVATRMGFITLIGEVGLGKTTVIRAFLDRFDRERLLPIYVFHPLMSFDELLELLSEELGLELKEGISSFNRLRAIQRELIRLFEERRQVVLVIDEAQRLPEDTLESLRLLTNLETTEAKLLQIVLIGQPELQAILAQPHLRQLDQRIVLRAKLDTLSREDALRYLRHRLTLAGADDPYQVFTPGALDAIVEAGAGVPRRLNILANRTLIDAFGADEKPVTAARVRRVAGQGALPATRRPERRGDGLRWALAAAPGLFLLALAGAAALEPQLAAQTLNDVSALFGQAGQKVETLASAQAAAPAPQKEAPAAESAPPAPKAAEPPTETQPAAVAAPPPKPPAAPVRLASASTSDLPAPASEPAKPATPPPADTPPVPDFSGLSLHDTPYVVVQGDTVWKICLKAYGPDIAPTMVAKVMSRNRMSGDARLLWGTTIVLPASKAS